jgi:hypothetical protein
LLPAAEAERHHLSFAASCFFYAAENGCCQLLRPSVIISHSLLPASTTETIRVPFLLLQAIG